MSLNIWHINCVIVLCLFYLSLLVRNAVCTLVYTTDSCMYMRNMCMYIIPDVEFTVSKIVLYEILIMLGIKFITKTKLLTWL